MIPPPETSPERGASAPVTGGGMSETGGPFRRIGNLILIVLAAAAVAGSISWWAGRAAALAEKEESARRAPLENAAPERDCLTPAEPMNRDAWGGAHLLEGSAGWHRAVTAEGEGVVVRAPWEPVDLRSVEPEGKEKIFQSILSAAPPWAEVELPAAGGCVRESLVQADGQQTEREVCSLAWRQPVAGIEECLSVLDSFRGRPFCLDGFRCGVDDESVEIRGRVIVGIP